MTTQFVETPASGAVDVAAREPIDAIKRRWPALFGAAITVAMVIGVVRALLVRGIGGLLHAVPADPRFYLCFALFYLSLPVGDFVIFRRLWAIPPAGLAALIQKRIANEVVLGYSGEAYFYAWARQRAQMVAAPFGAVKDVSILSAIAGNAMTLVMILLALPFGHGLLTPDQFAKLSWSTLLVIAMSLPFLIFSGRVFSLRRATLWWIFMVHVVRLVFGTVLIALTWHFAMPAISIGTWLLLSAGRLLTSRLPLVPNKDLLFANFAILLIGQGDMLANMIAVTAGLTLVVHIVLVGLFSLRALVKDRT